MSCRYDWSWQTIKLRMRLTKWFSFRADACAGNIQVTLVNQHNSNHLLVSWMCGVMSKLTLQVRKSFHFGLFSFLLSFSDWPFLHTHCRCRELLYPITLSNTHTHTHTQTHTWLDFSGRGIGSSQKPAPAEIEPAIPWLHVSSKISHHEVESRHST